MGNEHRPSPAADCNSRGVQRVEKRLQRLPTLVGIELRHRLSLVCTVLAEILLVNHAGLVDEERLNPRFVVLRRIRDISEAAGHFSIENVALSAALRIGALAIQPAEIIAVEGLRGVGLDGHSFLRRERDQRSKRAAGSALRRLPVQTVLLTGIADELLCVLFDAAVLLGKVLGLGVRERSADIDGSELVAAD